ncbi:splicing factor 3B subunit 1, putative [Plasmodium chabaudi chabaudi]|uniref:Splicing factor 3B subunit 1, putative n=1 Tax=Plasmodium chabaudi chabaudi TaxID=31271 RepID=A0A1D3LBS1_PLACU|nr:splicing factor 3B subunit 1, putative [Plasmodium chabaudi chabaudi]
MGTKRNESSKRDAKKKNIKYETDNAVNEIKYVREIDPMLNEDESDNAFLNNNNININNLKNEIVENELDNNNNVDDISLGLIKDKSIRKRENEFQRKKYDYILSPGRADPFEEKSPSPGERTYTDIMLDISKENKKNKILSNNKKEHTMASTSDNRTQGEKRHLRFGNETGDGTKSKWDYINEDQDIIDFGNMATPAPNKWGETPFILNDANIKNKKKKLSRWDKTGDGGGNNINFADSGTINSDMNNMKTPIVSGNRYNENMMINTPIVGTNMMTPMTPYLGSIQNNDYIKFKIKNEMDFRNRPLTDEDLDNLLPSEGYEIVKPPEEYEAIRKNKLKILFKNMKDTTTTPLIQGSTNIIINPGQSTLRTGDDTYIDETGKSSFISHTPFYNLPTSDGTLKEEDEQILREQNKIMEITNPQLLNELKYIEIKNEDYIYFNKLFQNYDEEDLSQDEIKERKIMLLLLKIKNGSPSIRRNALRTITDKVKELGPENLFNLILPLMMQNTLEDQERHLLVKVIDRILFKLDDLVRPFVHKILVVIEPLLIDEDYYARVEGREIISNLAKAAGLATMIGIMRPDIDHPDEYVRNTTARAFAVVASALGIPSLILFLKAVCQSKKSWEARHTGIKIVQQMAILTGCAVLPHLKQLVNIIAHGLHDEHQKVRTITALALAALAEAAAPYGIEAFDPVLRPLWKGITEYRGKCLASFLKAIGLIIPLMDAYHANYYTKEVMIILINEFNSPDEEMKKIVLKCVKQCIQTEGIEKDYINQEIVNPFFEKFWVIRNSSDKKNFNLIVDTTVEIANKIGGAVVIAKIVDDLKDPSEPYRKMVMQTIQNIINNLGVDDIDQKLEEQLIDGILYSFQEQTSDDYYVLLNSFDVIVNKLKLRMKPYLPQIAGIIRWRLNTPLPKVRQQSAELIARIAKLIKICDEQQMLGHLALYLYEYLGEEYPEVLGNILKALKSIVVVLGVNNMTPPIKDLLPRITPILKNRHEKVQENVIDLIGIIADKGGDMVSPKEWDRICFDLIELLKSNKKLIRRATIQTFGYIARTIGPFEVLTVLLNNLRVQERQLRVCTTVAIAIVADTCLPYSVLAALMNEYKTQDLNVQNGVLKALSFMFEYIGEIAKDYVYSVISLLEHALTDRDLVHRQIATWACKHLALGCFGLNREDALIHLLNHVWPNIFETSPHLIQAVIDSIDGFRVALGPAIIFQYLVQGIFHPSKKVREIYWKIYNNVYIGHQDSLVPIYPPFETMGDSNFARDELRYVL